jgi:hypothetical protein
LIVVAGFDTAHAAVTVAITTVATMMVMILRISFSILGSISLDSIPTEREVRRCRAVPPVIGITAFQKKAIALYLAAAPHTASKQLAVANKSLMGSEIQYQPQQTQRIGVLMKPTINEFWALAEWHVADAPDTVSPG